MKSSSYQATYQRNQRINLSDQYIRILLRSQGKELSSKNINKKRAKLIKIRNARITINGKRKCSNCTALKPISDFSNKYHQCSECRKKKYKNSYNQSLESERKKIERLSRSENYIRKSLKDRGSLVNEKTMSLKKLQFQIYDLNQELNKELKKLKYEKRNQNIKTLNKNHRGKSGVVKKFSEAI